MSATIMWFEDLRRKDVAAVGGKNSSLGEMVSTLDARGVKVPGGFATTSDAYWQFIEESGLGQVIRDTLAELESGHIPLAEAGATIRKAFLKKPWPDNLKNDILAAYKELGRRAGRDNPDVAVRSSATAEDLPDASFAGQQETYLNVSGEAEILEACRKCYASLFTDRAISYRTTKGFDHLKVALSVGVQMMVRSDIGGSGVMFSIDTETGFDKVVVINAAWGLGENVVQGAVDPDEFVVFKPLLENKSFAPIVEKRLGAKKIKMIYAADSFNPVKNVPTSKAERERFVLDDEDILHLARWAVEIENHYGCPMDMEWAKDGDTGELFIVQARPETVQSRKSGAVLQSYSISGKGEVLTTGLSVGAAAVAGQVCVIEDVKDIDQFVDGSILVTSTTDPDWVPIMKKAAGIITDHGGRTSHAAIVSRELGTPAIVGTGNATHVLHSEQEVTMSCGEGDEGFVYSGIAEINIEDIQLDDIPQTETKVMFNLANPGAAFRWWRIPSDGVGLARMEFVINNHIKVHPMALIKFDELKSEAAKAEIEELTKGYDDKPSYFVDKLSRGLARIGAAAHPNPVIVRMSDFKTNEYAGLLGGAQFEPKEENPMIGFRGASRYYSPKYRDGFALECKAIKRARDEMGFDNIIMMIPFCRSTGEADRVLEVMAENGLKRGENGLKVYVMCEIPANVVLADEFAKRFDGFSIGSNDLTQLTLGVDRDSEDLASLFDEQDPAVEWMIENVMREAHKAGAKVGLCGQGPSDHPQFAEFLVGCGIDSISVTPDSFVAVKRHVAAAEKRKS
ncbi:MAG: phosphoenolpyruvate synthase [Hyphomicrobiaceae bacterium]|nr:phosphoenolpyruvate synthase [Hyphomicrobiaceae bacterium]